MLTALALVALAGAPPNLEDIDTWEVAAGRLIDGPAGCWEVVGEASWNYEIGKHRSARGDAVFVGRLVAGIWTDIHIEPLGEDVVSRDAPKQRRIYHDVQRFIPLIGRVSPLGEEAEDEPRNQLRAALEELEHRTQSSWITTEEGRVQLHRAIPIRGKKSARITTDFGPESDAPTAWDAAFPSGFRVPNQKLPITISDAEIHLRGRPSGESVFPTAEAYRFTLRMLGFRLQASQTVSYRRFTACAE